MESLLLVCDFIMVIAWVVFIIIGFQVFVSILRVLLFVLNTSSQFIPGVSSFRWDVDRIDSCSSSYYLRRGSIYG